MANLYEGMFLMDPALASDWQKAESEINRVLGRAGATVLGIKNWDERKLAYPIGKHKRGLYALTFFRAEPDKITGLERDVQLGEQFMRALFLRREKMSDEDIQRALAAEAPKAMRYDDRPDRGERGGRGREEDFDGGEDRPRRRRDEADAEIESPVSVDDLDE